MDKAIKRAATCISHLASIDGFFATEDPLYRRYRDKFHDMGEAYDSFAKAMYFGGYGRQMQLADTLDYMILSRGAIWSCDSKNRSDYMRMILYTINQLLQEEHITYFPELRRRFLTYLENRGLDNLIEDARYKENYEIAKKLDEPLGYKEHKGVYWSIDHLLPKSLGTVIELVVYLFLMRNSGSYVLPLLLHQRMPSLTKHIIPPDFLVVKQGRVFGIEVKQLRPTIREVRHTNEFMLESGIPVLTASVPNTVPLRCPKCNKWILYCDNIIDKFCDFSDKIESEKIQCEGCNEEIYFGRLGSGEREYHYHLRCVHDLPYVKEVLAKPDQRSKRLIAYFPYVQGLERLTG